LINGIKVQPETIELVVDRLDQSEWLPAPFRAAADGCSILIERSALQVLEVSQESASPMPLLVTAGHGLEGLVMVNIEALGTLVVDGDPGDTEGVVRAIGLELATSFWMDRFDLSVVGFGAELERFDRVVSVVDVPDFLDGLYRRRLRNEVLLRESGFSSFGQARYKDESDRWDPIVVVCGPTVTKDAVVEFRQLASDPRLGISVVAVGDASDGQHVMRLSGSDSSLSPKLLGSVIFPQQVGPEDLNAVNSLLNTATSHESALRSEEPYVNLPVLMSTPTEDSGQGVLLKALSVEPEALTNGIQETEVEIAVLGQIEIRGAAREFTRAWAEELVVYLAMHPNGATNEAWATALWPDRLMAPSSLHSTASVARRALGEARNGRDHLPRSHSRLALSDTVSTDWSKFVLHADSDSPRRWRAALELVRGRPFEGLRSTDWPILEGIGPAIEAAVVDLSGRFSGWSLSQGDAQSAEWAARKGLLVSPYDERLYRMLMRAADLSGNPAGVESVMSELIKLVAEDVEPLESVHPSTMQLYRSLSRRRDAIPRSR
jgi:DNA-binding SARP family transcriptional activator